MFLGANIPESMRKVGHRAATDDPDQARRRRRARVRPAWSRSWRRSRRSGVKLNYPPDTCAELCWMAMHGLVAAMIMKPEFPWSDRDLLISAMLDIHLKGMVRSQ